MSNDENVSDRPETQEHLDQDPRVQRCYYCHKIVKAAALQEITVTGCQ